MAYWVNAGSRYVNLDAASKIFSDRAGRDSRGVPIRFHIWDANGHVCTVERPDLGTNPDQWTREQSEQNERFNRVQNYLYNKTGNDL